MSRFSFDHYDVTGSNRTTAMRPASIPERLANATPTGTSARKARSIGSAWSAISSTILTGRERRPQLGVPVPAARALAAGTCNFFIDQIVVNE
jgi:hypothetical protein